MKGRAQKKGFFSAVNTALLGDLQTLDNLNLMLFTSAQGNLFERNASLEILIQS